MKEDFLHYLWQVGKFDIGNLTTTLGAPIQIIRRGMHNQNAGPDFLNAKVKIGHLSWEGHVEIHLQASDWRVHRHHEDPAYNNVILHVVLEEDEEIVMKNGQPIPTLELKDRIPAGILGRYKQLAHTISDIPCERFLPQLDDLRISQWLERLSVQRLERKSKQILKLWDQFDRNGEQTLFYLWCKYMGGKVNAEAYAELARRVDVKFLWKKKPFLQQLEAYLLGLSGLLPEKAREVYPSLLHREFQYLSQAHNLRPMKGVEWRFFRMRPSNFPTVRLAQLAMIYHKMGRWLPWLQEASFEELKEALCVTPSAYWSSHYTFDKFSEDALTRVGEAQFRKLLINVVVPFRLAWSQLHPQNHPQDDPLELLSQLPPENNKIIRIWRDKGMNPRNALESQALIELKTEGCDRRRCMSCAFGNYFLSQKQQADIVEEAFVTLQPI